MTAQYYNNYEDTTNFSDNPSRLALATNVEQTITVPGNSSQKMQALFEYASNSNVFVGYNITATVPLAGTTDDVGSIEFKPKKRFVKGGDTLSLITPDASAYCGVSFRSLPA